MPSFWLKLSDIVVAWLSSVVVLLLLPIVSLPVLVFGWLVWGWYSPAAIYSFLYDKDFMAVAGMALLLLLIWTEGVKASLDEAPFLANLQLQSSNPGWLWRYYFHRNRDLIAAYWRVHNGEVEADSLSAYLVQHMPWVYRHHTQAMSFIPEWLTTLYTSGHSRRAHVRYTRNGPVSVRSHVVSSHTRSRRR